MKEEEILDKLRKMLFNTQKANECGLSNNDFKEDIEVLSGILYLYNKEKEKNKEVIYYIEKNKEKFKNLDYAYPESVINHFNKINNILK